MKLWESKSREGEGTKPETIKTKRRTERQEVATVKKHQVWQRDLVEKALGVGLGFIVELNVWEVDFKVEIGLEIILVLLVF